MEDSGVEKNWTEIRSPLGVGMAGPLQSQATPAASPSRRSFHTAIVFSEKMYIFGGKDTCDRKLNDVWVYYFDHEYWDRCVCQNPPSGRSHHTAMIHGDQMFVFGGQQLEEGKGLCCSKEILLLDMNVF